MALAALVACGGAAQTSGSGSAGGLAPPPARETHAVLAGGLCQDNRCSCRSAEGDGGVGAPEGQDRKRFEFRLGSAYELWVTVNKTTVLYKNPERAEDCFYVDLPTGAQQIELRAANPDGVSAALEIHELGTRTRSWYDTFAFSCGVPGVCSFEDLDTVRDGYKRDKRRLFDPCGTTKVKGVSWDHGHAPDQLHPSELRVRLTLDVYKFAAWKKHGDPSCGVGGGRPPGEIAGPDSEAAPTP